MEQKSPEKKPVEARILSAITTGVFACLVFTVGVVVIVELLRVVGL